MDGHEFLITSQQRLPGRALEADPKSMGCFDKFLQRARWFLTHTGQYRTIYPCSWDLPPELDAARKLTANRKSDTFISGRTRKGGLAHDKLLIMFPPTLDSAMLENVD
ncbi:hypothetical protein SELMODRAFT_432614 [Selaginella moellendorffii]|uniref:Uncharacterized protein n=1 Tax=Selaginella moellendorffii TaxID=88036 RepID=D8TGJ5_SELML|nr:hypothetical protein SELMODRAFT_432614 [Selaginella moellendorffii]